MARPPSRLRSTALPILGVLALAAIGLNVAALLVQRSGSGPQGQRQRPIAAATSAPVTVPRPAAKPPTTVAAHSAPPAYMIKRVLPIDGPLHYGDLHWDAAGVPAGPVVITVDIGARVISIFRGGYEIGTSAVIYGADEFPTPLGVYTVLQKDKHHRSSTYGGAPMPFGLRLTRDGVFIHGSPGADDRYMTHGCIGLPLNFAAKLFGAVRTGDRVIITNGETLAPGQPIPAA